MILFKGTLLPDSELPTVLDQLEETIVATRTNQSLDAGTVMDAIDALGRRLDAGELDDKIAQYAPPGTLQTLDEVRHLLRRETLEHKLAVELGADRLPQERPFGASIPMPLGTLLHVAAGNVTGLPAFTVVEGLLTGNINLLKLPRDDKGLSLAILLELVGQQPKLADYIYAFDISSSDTASLKRLAALADGIVVWGGDEAVSAMRKLAPPGCKLVEWGHRLSFAYISQYQEHPKELDDLAHHIVTTGGLLCSSCQVIYLDSDDVSAAEQFCKDFLPRLERCVRSVHTTPGKAAEAALYAYETVLEQVVDRKDSGDQVFRGNGCSITLRTDRELELSHLHGNVLVKLLPRQELVSVLHRQKGHLQTAGLICPDGERAELTRLLARSGVNRVTRAGSMSHTFPGEAHDGEYPLRRYQRMVDIQS